MTNTKHTPGPWCIGAPYGHLHNDITALDGKVYIGTVFTRRWDNGKDAPYMATMPDPEGQANAALIAAAPDTAAERDALQSSLRVLLDWCERMQIDGKHLIGSICKEADDAQFRAAIKQAHEVLGVG